MIDSVDEVVERRVRGHDRLRLGALAGSMGVAFGLPHLWRQKQVMN